MFTLKTPQLVAVRFEKLSANARRLIIVDTQSGFESSADTNGTVEVVQDFAAGRHIVGCLTTDRDISRFLSRD